jgi:hypothetical protein
MAHHDDPIFREVQAASLIANLPEILVADILASGKQATYVEVQRSGEETGHYVQVLADGEGEFWVECVSNNYLEGDRRLTDDQELTLFEIGFAPAEPLGGNHPNWWVNVHGVEGTLTAARLMGEVLLRVFGVSGDDLIWVGHRELL